MEFQKTALSCVRPMVREVQNQEVTQEVRLPEAMPDVGKVLGCWGQIFLRSKEWQTASAGVSGGVMAFILYQPEDGSQVRRMESWMPFQMRWNLPPTQTDGTLCVQPLLRGLDARSASARKLMVRANVSLAAEALAPAQAELFQPGEVPAEVQLLRRSYPVFMPTEAGEKAFSMEEQLDLPASAPQVEKILHYSLQPELIDQKVMAGKVVFRGMAVVRMLGCDEAGQMHMHSFEIPFSQYSQLEQPYDQEADASVQMAVTALEMELSEDGNLQMKADLLGQYMVFDRPVLEIVADAYSNEKQIAVQMDHLDLPSILDLNSQSICAQSQIGAQDPERIIDVCFQPEHPVLRRSGDAVIAELAGTFSVLYCRENGALEQGSVRWQMEQTLAADAGCMVWARIMPSGIPQGTIMGESIQLRADLRLCLETDCDKGLPMVTGLEIGDPIVKDPQRPCLILRRVGREQLWDLAKESHSTMEAIRDANQLTQEPQEGQMLLIPVY